MKPTPKNTIETSIVTDDNSPSARADRLKWLRNMANLSRKQMCEDSDLNINTYIGYEIGRYGGITRWGAEKVIKRVAREGVQCSYNWLMNNIGPGPQISVGFKKDQKLKLLPVEAISSDEEEDLIIQELMFFRNLYKQTADHIVHDDAMFPYYVNGEFIAGVKRYAEVMATVIGQDCIVQTLAGETLFRRLCQGTESDHYILLCLNTQTTVSPLVHYNIKLQSVAPIIWRRRRNI